MWLHVLPVVDQRPIKYDNEVISNYKCSCQLLQQMCCCLSGSEFVGGNFCNSEADCAKWHLEHPDLASSKQWKLEKTFGKTITLSYS